jgi:hypothetical protein
MFTFQSILIFTLFGKFERWVLFVFEGCTLTIHRLPSVGFKMAKSGVWGRLHINNPPTAVWGDLRGQLALPDLVRLAKGNMSDRAIEQETGFLGKQQ